MGRIRRIQNVVFCLFSGDGPVMVLFKCRILHLPQMERIGRIVYSPTDETDLTDILYNQKIPKMHSRMERMKRINTSAAGQKVCR